MAYFKIDNVDFSHMVSGLKCGFEVLVSEQSGRNAVGDTVIDIINRKDKIYITTRALTEDEMVTLLSAVQSFVVNISYLNPRTKKLKTNVRCYIGTPESEYYTIQNYNVENKTVLFKPLQLNFIEL